MCVLSTDKNECQLGESTCPSRSRCVNEEGGYTCLCPAGYGYNKKRNECTGSLGVIGKR